MVSCACFPHVWSPEYLLPYPSTGGSLHRTEPCLSAQQPVKWCEHRRNTHCCTSSSEGSVFGSTTRTSSSLLLRRNPPATCSSADLTLRRDLPGRPINEPSRRFGCSQSVTQGDTAHWSQYRSSIIRRRYGDGFLQVLWWRKEVDARFVLRLCFSSGIDKSVRRPTTKTTRSKTR